MKKLFAMLLCLALLGGSALAQTSLNVVYCLDTPGLNTMNENGEIEGFNAELIDRILEMDDGFTVNRSTLVPDDLKLARMEIQNSEAGVMLPAYRGWGEYLELTDNNFGTRPYLTLFPVILVPRDSDIRSVADLAGKTVYATDAGIQQSVESYNAAHADAPLDCSFFDTDEYYSYTDHLLSGTLDAVIVDNLTAIHYAGGEDSEYIAIEIPDAEQLYHWDVYLAFDVWHSEAAEKGEEAANKHIAEVRAQFEADLDALVVDGTYGQLCEKYFGRDMTPFYTFGETVPEAAGPAEADAQTGEEAPAEEKVDETAEKNEGEKPTVYTDRETVKKVQQALNDAGFNCGTPDGLAGKKTNQSVIDFKAANGMDDASADITDALLAALGIG